MRDPLLLGYQEVGSFTTRTEANRCAASYRGRAGWRHVMVTRDRSVYRVLALPGPLW